MKLGDANYDSTVEQKRTELRGHKHTQLTESECAKEIEAITGGAVSSFATEETHPALTGTVSQEFVNIGKPVILRKRRGRPPGSKNRPKVK